MLLNLHKRGWTEGLKLRDFEEQKHGNEKAVKVCYNRNNSPLQFCHRLGGRPEKRLY